VEEGGREQFPKQEGEAAERRFTEERRKREYWACLKYQNSANYSGIPSTLFFKL
jgi:hypothetical protein